MKTTKSLFIIILALSAFEIATAGIKHFDKIEKRIADHFGEKNLDLIIDLNLGNIELEDIKITPELDDFDETCPVKIRNISYAALRVFEHEKMRRPRFEKSLQKRLLRDRWELILNSKSKDANMLIYLRDIADGRTHIAALLLTGKKLILFGLEGILEQE
ncbi:MAG: hypothetical protein ACE5I1_23195 [bacterium]